MCGFVWKFGDLAWFVVCGAIRMEDVVPRIESWLLDEMEDVEAMEVVFREW